jgi:hypothetical protein
VLAVCGLLAAACGGAGEDGGTDRLQDTDEEDAGTPIPDDDDSGEGGADDDGSNADDVADDVLSDDDLGSGDDIDVADDDVLSDDDLIIEGDASVPDGTDVPIELPGDGFVTIDTTDAGTFEILCGTEVCLCADGLDNDEDGLADGADSECTGPFDHNEETFATGIPGDNRDPKWQDCFFDGNSGAGDDSCRYHTDCLTGDLPEDDADCTVTDQCREYCAPLTPPGCDCFGCCEIALDDGSTVSILASDLCSIDNIDDEEACPRCVMTDTCGNECGECEICVGQTLEDLPETCFEEDPPDGSGGTGAGGDGPGDGPGGSGTGGSDAAGAPNSGGSGTGGTPGDDPPPNVCDGGAISCSTSDDCGAGQYCGLGCCITVGAR